jgi:hypothetical protein
MSALATAKRPLLYFGNGCRSALIGPRRMTGEARAEVEHRRACFQNLTTRFALAVTTTLPPCGRALGARRAIAIRSLDPDWLEG